MKRAVLLFVSLALAGVSPVRAGVPIVQVPVSFEVTNVNLSVTSCPTDGETYTVRGTLAGPAAGFGDGVTLYVHGSGDANSWNLQAFPEFDYLAAMARLGHTSVFLHTLGYGPSDAADGSQVCFGSIASTVDQVIDRLRSGDYGGASSPAFEQVALAGHSGGGIVVELYSVSFDNIGALVIVGWADNAPLLTDFYDTVLMNIALPCAQGGESKSGGGPGGWSADPSESFVRALAYNVRPDVVDEVLRTWEGDPCGVGVDAGQALAASIALAPTVSVPILLAYGDHDPFLGAQLDVQRARYLGSDDVSLAIVPDSGHMLMLGNTLPSFSALTSG